MTNLKLITSNINKSYDGKPVLRDCSFSFEKSGTYVLMGPNGCGKSTFLRICALLEEPDKGEVNYFSGGALLEKNIELKRSVTLLLPRVGVFNTSTFKNVAYGLRIRGMRVKEVRDKVGNVLEFVGLMHKKNQNALTLSSGETQRMGIARALVVEPEIIFLDEPTAFVDEENKEIIEDIILRLNKSGTSQVIMATHDRSQAEKIGNWLIVMKEGKIISP